MQKLAPVAQQLQNLTWSHYILILPLKELKEIEYYLYLASRLNLSKRELRERIKSKEYERLGKNIDIEKFKVESLIKNPILVKVKNKNKKLTEYTLHQSIIENIDDFLKELGIGFTYVGSEVKIKIGDRYNYIDFLLFNYIYNCFVVIELKVTEIKAEYIGQIMKYIGYVDKHIRKSFHDETVGIIICRKENKYVMEYCTNPNIFVSTYQTI